MFSLTLLALVVAACTRQSGEPDGTTGVEPIPVESRLAVIDAQGSVVTMRTDGSDPVTVAEGDQDRFHFQPQWSAQTGRLAWGESSSEGFSVVIANGDGTGRSTYPTAGLPYYLAWAPDGTRLAALYNNARRQVEARVVDLGSNTTTVLGSATPYYFSWDPTSSRIVANRNGDTLDVIDLEGSVTTIAPGSLTYLAPAWTPAGIFHLTSEGIVLSDELGTSTPVAGIPHAAWFAPNPDGTRLAVVALGGDDDGPRELTVAWAASDLTPNLFSVIDVPSGDIEIVTNERTAGFFWSPDGSALAVLVPGRVPGELQWLVWRDGSSQRLASFAPVASFVNDVLRFAPQYALSLNVWSPESNTLAFAGTVAGRSGVWVQAISEDEPTWVADGTWVAWSRS